MDGAINDRCEQPLKSRSNQTFHPVLAVKLMGIMLTRRCGPTTFHTITIGDADGAKSGRCDQSSPSPRHPEASSMLEISATSRRWVLHLYLYAGLGTMIWENRKLVTNELVEFEK